MPVTVPPPDPSCGRCGAGLGRRYFADCPVPASALDGGQVAGEVVTSAGVVRLNLCGDCHARLFPLPPPPEVKP